MGSRERGAWFVAAAVVAMATLGMSCGGGGDDPPDDGSAAAETTTTAEQTATTLSDTDQVRAAFEAFNAMLRRLAEAPDPADPELPQRASGDTLSQVVERQTTLQTIGYRVVYGERAATDVLSVTMEDANTAVVLECTVDDRTEITPTETLGPFLETYRTEWTLVRTNGVWLVDSSRPVERREGEHPCE